MNTSSNSDGGPVSSRPIVTQEWSLHAEVTFSQDRVGGCTPARQPSNDSGMYTSCSWNSQATPATCGVTMQPPLHPCYGFQRGNILFTTTPPSRITLQPPSDNHVLSYLQATNNCSQPTSVHPAVRGHSPQPYNRRCKSTCSIILSGVHDPPSTNILNTSCDDSVNRGMSCSPTPRCLHTITHRCGDPVCYHAGCPSLGNTFDKPGAQCMTAPEPTVNKSCEVCGGGRSPTSLRRAARANTFTTHFCTHVPERAHSFGGTDCKQTASYVRESRDAAIQTNDLESIKSSYKKGSKSVKDSNFLCVPDEKGNSPERRKSSKKLSRSPARLRGKSPLIQSRRNSLSDSRASTPEAVHHKPRTVHIDVYCTGSEDADASTSDTQEDVDSFSSPQTVFESDKLRVVQKHAGKNDVPLALQPQHSKPDVVVRSESLKCDTQERVQRQLFRRFDSDDGLSSQYPSKQSSYSTFPDSESSLVSDLQTSRDPSSSTISSSSCAIFNEDYDSVAATSWKDTITEIDSLDQSNISLAQSDSFEYADAADRLRIREKEKAWACSLQQAAGLDVSKSSLNAKKSWLCPDTERKHLLQQQKFREYLEKHHGSGFPLWKPNASEDSEEEEEEDDDETGDAWIFSASASGFTSEKVSTIKREGTVKKAGAPLVASVIENISPNSMCSGNNTYAPHESGSLSDSGTSTKHRFVRRDVIGPFGVKCPSPPPSKVESIVTTPFTAVGSVTNQRFKAQKFGTIVGAFRKPGHHVGPARNPDCTCEHCREYYETIGHRGRARSMGDMPYATRSNLKM